MRIVISRSSTLTIKNYPSREWPPWKSTPRIYPSPNLPSPVPGRKILPRAKLVANKHNIYKSKTELHSSRSNKKHKNLKLKLLNKLMNTHHGRPKIKIPTTLTPAMAKQADTNISIRDATKTKFSHPQTSAYLKMPDTKTSKPTFVTSTKHISVSVRKATLGQAHLLAHTRIQAEKMSQWMSRKWPAMLRASMTNIHTEPQITTIRVLMATRMFNSHSDQPNKLKNYRDHLYHHPQQVHMTT